MIIERNVSFQNRRISRGKTTSKSRTRVPRIARLMALAIRIDQLIRAGLVTDQAEIARIGHVTRARSTQILNLLQLAPDIQEQLLFLTSAERGRPSITERQLRPISATHSWKKQREMWYEAIE